MRAIWRVARREFKSYFDHPTAYILIVAFLALSLFLTFRTLYATAVADYRAFFDLLPWLFAVFIPAITMRSMAEERGRQTLEWLMSQPLTEMQLVLGKCLGDWMFALVALAGTVPTAIGLLLVSDASIGPMVAQYIGASLLALQFVGIGLFASSATKNQITAFILGAALSFVLVLIGMNVVLVGLPAPAADVVTRLAVVPHFDSVSRGVLDLRDILYFLTTGALFIVLAYFLVVRLRLSPARGSYGRLRIGTLVLAIGVVTLNLLGRHIRGRLDLTADKLYTLSDGTKNLLKNLDDVVTVKLYVSKNLPSQVVLTRRDVEDLLDDYKRYAGGNLQIEVDNPDDDKDVQQQAQSYGIQPIQFNVMRQDQFQVQRGWFGMTVIYADQHKTIPYIDRSDDLEYRLTSDIASMTNPHKPTIAFLTGYGARNSYDVGSFRTDLLNRYNVTQVNIAGDTVPSINNDSIDVVALIGPRQTLSDTVADSIQAFVKRGGSAFLALDGVNVDPRAPQTTPRKTGLGPFLKSEGLQIEPELAADYRSNQTVSMGRQGLFNVVRSYPLWPVAMPAVKEHPVTRELESMTFPWPSPIEITDTTRVTPLWETTQYGDVIPAGGSIQPDAIPAPDQSALSKRILAVAVDPRKDEEKGSGQAADSAEGGRMVVVGNSNFLQPQFVQNSPQNLTFASNAVDWLSQDEALISIRSKDRTPPPLVFTSDFQRLALRWGNLVGIPVLFILVGLMRGVQRKREAERLWEEVRA